MSYTFAGPKLQEITGPGVYIFWRGERMLYVGATAHGLGRCCQAQHKMSLFFNDPAITLMFEPMPDAATAFEMEERLITEHQPEFNVHDNEYQKDLRRRQKARYRARKEKASGHTQRGKERAQKRERQVLESRYYLGELRKEWPEARIVHASDGWPMIECSSNFEGAPIYYSRDLDSYVFTLA